MTLQETLTYLIVASAAFYTAYQFVMVFVVEKKQSGGCCGCDGNCSVKEIK